MAAEEPYTLDTEAPQPLVQGLLVAAAELEENEADEEQVVDQLEHVLEGAEQKSMAEAHQEQQELEGGDSKMALFHALA